MMRQRPIQALVALLAVQVVLLIVVFWPRPAASGAGKALLPNFQSADVVELRIADADGNQVVLRREGDTWVLPEFDNYPALAGPAEQLLSKVAELTDRRLATRTAASHKQLQVAADNFVRKIDLEMADGARYRLYIGTTESYGTGYVRLDGYNETYMGSLTSSSAGVQLTSWVDTLYVNLSTDAVTAVQLQNQAGALSFAKDDQGTWSLAGLAPGQTLDQNKVKALVAKVAQMRMLRPLGKEVLPEYGMERPLAVVQVKTADKEVTLTIGARGADSSYVVISSESPYYVRVSGSLLQDVVEKGADGYTVPPPTATPAATP